MNDQRDNLLELINPHPLPKLGDEFRVVEIRFDGKHTVKLTPLLRATDPDGPCSTYHSRALNVACPNCGYLKEAHARDQGGKTTCPKCRELDPAGLFLCADCARSPRSDGAIPVAIKNESDSVVDFDPATNTIIVRAAAKKPGNAKIVREYAASVIHWLRIDACQLAKEGSDPREMTSWVAADLIADGATLAVDPPGEPSAPVDVYYPGFARLIEIDEDTRISSMQKLEKVRDETAACIIPELTRLRAEKAAREEAGNLPIVKNLRRRYEVLVERDPVGKAVAMLKRVAGQYPEIAELAAEGERTPYEIAEDLEEIDALRTNGFVPKPPNGPVMYLRVHETIELDPAKLAGTVYVTAVAGDDPAVVDVTDPIKRWPFRESPGEFANRLRGRLRNLRGPLPDLDDVLVAVRSVLIEEPPVLANWAFDVVTSSIPECGKPQITGEACGKCVGCHEEALELMPDWRASRDAIAHLSQSLQYLGVSEPGRWVDLIDKAVKNYTALETTILAKAAKIETLENTTPKIGVRVDLDSKYGGVIYPAVLRVDREDDGGLTAIISAKTLYDLRIEFAGGAERPYSKLIGPRPLTSADLHALARFLARVNEYNRLGQIIEEFAENIA